MGGEEETVLEAEIARLEAELQGTTRTVDLRQYLSSAKNNNDNSDYQQTNNSYDGVSFLFADSSAGLSYDEITVDTVEFTQLLQQQQQQQHQQPLPPPPTAGITTCTNRRDQQQSLMNISIGGRSSSSMLGSFKQEEIIIEEEVEEENLKNQNTTSIKEEEDDEAARIQREIDETEAAMIMQQQQQQPRSQQSLRRAGRRKRLPSKSSLAGMMLTDNNDCDETIKNSFRGGQQQPPHSSCPTNSRQHTKRDPSSSSLISTLSYDESSFRQSPSLLTVPIDTVLEPTRFLSQKPSFRGQTKRDPSTSSLISNLTQDVTSFRQLSSANLPLSTVPQLGADTQGVMDSEPQASCVARIPQEPSIGRRGKGYTRRDPSSSSMVSTLTTTYEINSVQPPQSIMPVTTAEQTTIGDDAGGRQQREIHPSETSKQPPPPRPQPSIRRNNKRDLSSSSLVSTLSTDKCSFRQPNAVVEASGTTTIHAISAMEDEAAKIQREIDEMEAALAMVTTNDEPLSTSSADVVTGTPHTVQPQTSVRSHSSKSTKKVLQRKVRKKISDHSLSFATTVIGVTQPEQFHQQQQQQQQSEELEAELLQRQIEEMEAELTAVKETPPSKSTLNRHHHPATRAFDNDDENVIVNVRTQPEIPMLSSFGTTKQSLSQETSDTDENNFRRPPNPFASAGLLSAISNAATDREKRLASGGKKRITAIAAPNVNQAAPPPQLSTSLAEMISARAVARDERLAKGGEKRMTALTPPKEEIKKTFSEIVAEAASMGRLTRLDEHVVVAIAVEKTPEQEWKSKGLLAIQWRSNHMAVINEAARVGNEVKMPEKVVSNAIDGTDGDDMMDAFAAKPISERKRQLLATNSTIGEGQAKVDKLILYRKEEQPREHLLIKPMAAYSSIEEIRLPREAPPRVDPILNAQKLNKYKREMLESGRPMVDISKVVAERAWERRARLDRPGAMPKMVEKCDCPFCQSASPFQTFAYRELFKNRHQIAAQKEIERLEMERKKEEKRRQLEEKRKLEQEVAEAEAAIAAAQAVAAAAKAAQDRTEQIESAAPQNTLMPPPDTTPCCACTIM